MKRLMIYLLMIAALVSCDSNPIDLKPNVTGKAGEIVIVCDKVDWEGEIGTAIRNIIAVDYPMLPQKEPLFTLFSIMDSDFSDLFRTHRNIVLVRIDPALKEEGRLILQKNIWAKPQTVVTIAAKDREEAQEVISRESYNLRAIFEQAERDRLIENAMKYQEVSLHHSVADRFDGAPYFPTGYKLKKETDDFMWISYDTYYTMQGIFVYQFPCSGNSRINLDTLVTKRNEFLKKYVPGMFPDTYMTTSKIITPSLSWLKYKGRDFAEIRGLWDVHNDFMGGPFVAHAFYDLKRKNIIVLEGFVYAPKYDKRNYLRQVESIIYSFRWNRGDAK